MVPNAILRWETTSPETSNTISMAIMIHMSTSPSTVRRHITKERSDISSVKLWYATTFFKDKVSRTSSNYHMSLVPFLFLDPTDAVRFTQRWRPQSIAGQVVSVSGMHAYFRARIQLRHPDCVGMLSNIRNTGFIIEQSNATSNTYTLVACLWSSGTPSVEEFRDLREWCEFAMPGVILCASGIDDEMERELWELSSFDA